MSNAPTSPTDPQGSTVVIDTGAPQGQPQGQQPVPGNVGDGVLVGDVRQPAITQRLAPGQQPVPPVVPPGQQGQQPLTEREIELIEQARQQERDKLYARLGRVDEMEATVATLAAERQAAEDARVAAETAAQEAARAKELEEMDLRTRLETMATETQAQFRQLEEDRRVAEAMLEKERQIGALAGVRAQLLQENAQHIIPQLADFVTGNTPEELQASLQAVIDRSNAITQDVQTSLAQTRQQMPGVAPTGMPAGMGPLEQGATSQSFSAKQIADMDLATYAQHRDRLKAAGRQQFYGQ